MKLPSYRANLLVATAEKKFKEAWEHAKAVRETCKLIGKNCIEPFNRAIEEFEKDLNEIRELAGLGGKTELPRLKETTLEEIGRIERGVIPRVIWEFQREIKTAMEKTVEAENDNDYSFEPDVEMKEKDCGYLEPKEGMKEKDCSYLGYLDIILIFLVLWILVGALLWSSWN